MKKTTIIILFLCIGYNAYSQILISLLLGDKLNSDKLEFGIDGGLNFARISNLKPSSHLTTYNLGFYFDLTLKESLLLHTGVIVKSTQGADKLDPYPVDNPGINEVFSSGFVTRKINNFSVPVLLKYRFAGIAHFEAGPMLALRTTGYDIFNNSINEEEDLSYKVNIKDKYKRIDAGIMCGAGFKLSKVPKSSQIGIRYYYGLVDPLKNNTGKSQNFSSLYIFFSIPVGANKGDSKSE